jgi:hypothetical protein
MSSCKVCAAGNTLPSKFPEGFGDNDLATEDFVFVVKLLDGGLSITHAWLALLSSSATRLDISGKVSDVTGSEALSSSAAGLCGTACVRCTSLSLPK